MTSSSMAAQRLQTAAFECCKAGGDDGSVTVFVDILLEPFKSLDRAKEWELECETLLQQARSLLDPSLPSGKKLMDLVGIEVPRVVVQYAGVSKECRESSDSLIQALATAFDPAREMFTAFLEVINMYSKSDTLPLCLPMISGLSLVFPRIGRRTADFFKEAVPALVELGRSSGQYDVDTFNGRSEDILYETSNPDQHSLSEDSRHDNIQNEVIIKLIHVAKTIKRICDSVKEMEKLRDTLGIFILQLLAVPRGAMSDSTNALPDGGAELMGLLSFSKISLSEMVCTTNIDKIYNEVFDEEEIYAQRNRLEARRGAALAVYWAIQMGAADRISREIAGLQESLRRPGKPMVLDIVGLASNLLIPDSGIQEISFQHKGLSLMTCVLEVYCSSSKSDDASHAHDALDVTIQIVPALQRLRHTIIYIPSPMLRRQAYGILIKVITEVLHPGERFAALQSLIASSSDHPSLVSLLLTCVRGEVLKACREQKLDRDVSKATSSPLSPFLSKEVLEFIQYGFRTKDGEIVELPTNLDAVVGALNLYKFILILESSGHTNYTHVLCREELVKGRTYWLLPLRQQILKVLSELEDLAIDGHLDIRNGLDLSLSILYQCLGTVEQELAKLPN